MGVETPWKGCHLSSTRCLLFFAISMIWLARNMLKMLESTSYIRSGQQQPLSVLACNRPHAFAHCRITSEYGSHAFAMCILCRSLIGGISCQQQYIRVAQLRVCVFGNALLFYVDNLALSAGGSHASIGCYQQYYRSCVPFCNSKSSLLQTVLSQMS